jgi:ADP-ribose pyrophosphatase
MTHLAWALLSEEPFSLGWRKILRRTYRLPNGRQGVFDIKDEIHYVTLLCMTPDQRVVLVRQFRPGPGEVLLEMPGGGIEAGETPVQAAARELLEETGYSGEIHPVCACPHDAYSTAVRHVFVVTAARKVSGQHLDPVEFIEPQEVSLADFRAHLRRGRMSDVEAGYLGLDYLGLL